jgi:prevent-host-death family protein
MSSRKVSFTHARESLSTLIDEVRRSGQPVTILKRGRPAAVLVNCEVFDRKISGKKKKPWRLEGSGTVLKGVDIDEAILETCRFSRSAHQQSLRRLTNSLPRK